MKQNKFTKSARGQSCQVRLDFICDVTEETVILAHLPEGGFAGMGQKCNDLFSVYSCGSCHSVIDRQVPLPINFKDHNEVMVYAYQGHMRTLQIMQDKGLIKA